MMQTAISRAVIHGALDASPDARLSRVRMHLPAILSTIAGMVDLLGFFTLGNVFTAHITGNLVVVAASIARGGPWNPAQVLTIPVFTVALGAAWMFARVSGSRGIRLAYQLLVIQFVLLVLVLAINVSMHTAAHPHGASAVLAAMIAVLAMAFQYALFRLALPQAVSTAVMTGNLTSTVLALMDRLSIYHSMLPDDNDRLAQSLRLLIGFFLGCVVAAAAIPMLGDWAWSLPVLLALVAILYIAAVSRSTTNTQRK